MTATASDTTVTAADSTAAATASDTDHYDTIIIGSGFAGLAMAIKLKEAGQHDFLVLEKADSVGGTWRENHYPGCACDVPSHLYCFSFEPNPDWSRMFASQPEIRAYLERCTDKYGVRPYIRFNAPVTRARFDDEEGLWRVQAGERAYTARVLVAGFGPLSRPAYPQIDGLESFRGRAFHSAEWDPAYDVSGKRVAVVGTGASAIQFVPEIAGRVKELYLFQRTPPWILPKPDRRVTKLERRLFKRFPALQHAYREWIYWRLESRVVGFTRHPWIMKAAEAMAKRHIARSIEDPELRRKLTPSYTIGCKRILMSNDYYQALTRHNVEVITGGVSRVTERGVVDSEGKEHEVDAIVFGTGFEVQDPLGAMTITGRDGLDLKSLWREHGMEAYLGTAVAGFPNLFVLIGPNTGLGHNSMVYMIESQVHYVIEAMKTMRERGLSRVEVKPEVQRTYNGRVQSQFEGTVWASGCASWYLDRQGRNRTIWPGFTFKFRQATRTFRPEDYDLAPSRVRAQEAVAA